MRLLQQKNMTRWIEAEKRMNSSKLVKMVNNSKYISESRAPGIGVAFAESYFLRKLMMPVLVPLKLWASYQIVLRFRNSDNTN